MKFAEMMLFYGAVVVLVTAAPTDHVVDATIEALQEGDSVPLSVLLRPLRHGTGTLPTRDDGSRLRDMMALYANASQTSADARRLTTSGFDIVVQYVGIVPSHYKIAFDAARSVWCALVQGYLPGISMGAVIITASFPDIDGAGGVLGQAGPTYVRQGYTTAGKLFVLTTAGVMQFDSGDVASLDANGIFDDVVLHEMGHVLGIGALWNTVPFGYAGSQSNYKDGTGQYAGSAGNAAFVREIDNRATAFIPVELGGGIGTKNSHWDELDRGACCTGLVTTRAGNSFDVTNELMTGWLGTSLLWVSAFTARSLEDIGFKTNVCVDITDCSVGSVCALFPGCVRGNAASCTLPSLCVAAATVPTSAATTTTASNRVTSHAMPSTSKVAPTTTTKKIHTKTTHRKHRSKTTRTPGGGIIAASTRKHRPTTTTSKHDGKKTTVIHRPTTTANHRPTTTANKHSGKTVTVNHRPTTTTAVKYRGKSTTTARHQSTLKHATRGKPAVEVSTTAAIPPCLALHQTCAHSNQCCRDLRCRVNANNVKKCVV